MAKELCMTAFQDGSFLTLKVKNSLDMFKDVKA